MHPFLHLELFRESLNPLIIVYEKSTSQSMMNQRVTHWVRPSEDIGDAMWIHSRLKCVNLLENN